MSGLKMYVVDAFTEQVFGGNPAAVCPLERWLDDDLMLAIAAENNLSETAFFVPSGEGRYKLRWFTPVREIELCGHATLASAYVVFNHLGYAGDLIRFDTMSGELTVARRAERLELDLPAYGMRLVDDRGKLQNLARCLGVECDTLYEDDHFALAPLDTAAQVRQLSPASDALIAAGLGVLIVTAPSDERGIHFVSRVFAPAVGIPEDPVTGAAHCRLVPYWAPLLGTNQLVAKQVSARGGQLWCELRGNRVALQGHAALYSESTLRVG